MKTNIFDRLAILVVTAILAGCSDDTTSPVTNNTNSNPSVARPRVSSENGLPPVPVRDLRCMGGGTGAVCSDFGFVATVQNNTWRLLDTGQSANLSAVWGTSIDDFYVAGTGGCALYWNGTAFSELHVGVADDFNDVWGSARDDVWFVGRNTIVHWDGTTAATYNYPTLPVSGVFYCIDGTASDNVWVGCTGGNVLHWDGTAWTLTDLGTHSFYSIFVTGTEVFLGADGGRLVHFDGTSWSAFTVPGASAIDNFNAVAGTGPNRVYALGRDAMIYYWDGTAWTDKSDPFFTTSYDILTACMAGTTVVAGGYYLGSTPNLTEFDGTSWAPAASQTASGEDLYAVWTFDEDNAYAFGAKGTILHRDATGWSTVTHGLTTEYLYGAWASGPSNVYAVGNDGTVMHYDGSAWSLATIGSGTMLLNDVSGNGPNNVWTIAHHELWQWDGSVWTDRSSELPGPSGMEYEVIYVAPSGDVFVGGDLLAHYDGSTWTPIPLKAASSGAQLQHMFGLAADDIWMSDNYSIMHWDGSELDLRWINYTADLYAMAGRDGNILAAQAGSLVQFVSGIPAALSFPPTNLVQDAHTGADGVTYVVGRYGQILRVD